MCEDIPLIRLHAGNVRIKPGARLTRKHRFPGEEGPGLGGQAGNFDPAKKYPLLMLIHGGPQGVWGDSWSNRWNPQLFAAAGFIVFAPNPRGSTGFGQAFTDDVTKDWGGKAYEDIMKGVDFAAALPYVDKDRVVAAGASYGGYMINWMCTQTKRFKALVSHDGVYDLESMAGSTEEQWFTDWEFGGPPWKDRTQYEKYSPSRFIAQCTTPSPHSVSGELDRQSGSSGLQQDREAPSGSDGEQAAPQSAEPSAGVLPVERLCLPADSPEPALTDTPVPGEALITAQAEPADDSDSAAGAALAAAAGVLAGAGRIQWTLPAVDKAANRRASGRRAA